MTLVEPAVTPAGSAWGLACGAASAARVVIVSAETAATPTPLRNVRRVGPAGGADAGMELSGWLAMDTPAQVTRYANCISREVTLTTSRTRVNCRCRQVPRAVAQRAMAATTRGAYLLLL